MYQGRLADKKKLRKIAKQMTEDHEDDLFESTPLKNVNPLNVSISEDEEANRLVDGRLDSPVPTQPQTPGLKKTPELLTHLDEKRRNEADSYVNQVKNKRKKNNIAGLNIFQFEEVLH